MGSKRIHQGRRAQPVAPQSPSSGRTTLLEAAVLVLALALRLFAVLQLGDHPALQPRGGLDDSVYVEFGRRVATGDLVLGPGAYFVSPFYAYFLGAIFALTNGSLVAARLAQALLGTVSVGLLMRCAASWFGRRAGLIAGAVAACTGLFVFNEILILQSSLDTFLTSVVLLALTRAVKSESPASFSVAGLAFAALAANRPNALACLVAVAAFWLAAKRSRSACLNVAALGLGAALLLGPMAVRNRIVAGEWVLVTSHGGLNFFVGNGQGATGTWRMVAGVSNNIKGQERDTIEVAGGALGHRVSAGEASGYFYGLAWSWIRAHPGDWLRLMARKAALTFSSSDAALNFSYAYFAHEQTTILSALVVGPWLIVPFGILGLAAGAPRYRRAAYLTWAAFPVLYALTLMAFFVASRYRLPLLVALAAGTGFAIDSIWRALEVRAARDLAIQLGTLTVLMLLVNWPMSVNDGRAFQREFHIVHLLTDGRVNEAERLLEEAEARQPLPGPLLCRVGLVFRTRGDMSRSIAYLQRAAATEPTHAWIRFHLGETLLSVGRAADALPHLEAARNAFASSPSGFNRADGVSGLEGRTTGSGMPPAVIATDLAGAYTMLGQLDRARGVLANVEVSSVTDDAGLLQLGEAALQLEAPETAERFLRALILRTPSTARAHEQLGFALGMQHRNAEAISALERAVRLDSQSSTAHLHLGLAYAQSRRFQEARTEIEASVRLDPGNEEARAWQARLQQLK